jgi:hypothetical protein
VDPWGLVNWGQVGLGFTKSLIGLKNGAVGIFLISMAGAEVESLFGIPFAAHTLGAGITFFLTGAAGVAWGLDDMVSGVYDWEEKRREAQACGESEAEADLAKMQEQFDRISEWAIEYKRTHSSYSLLDS